MSYSEKFEIELEGELLSEEDERFLETMRDSNWQPFPESWFTIYRDGLEPGPFGFR